MPSTPGPTPRDGDQETGRPRKRVRAACERCRRLKLKCGPQRPCPLCLHSEVRCIPQSTPRAKPSLYRFIASRHPPQRKGATFRIDNSGDDDTDKDNEDDRRQYDWIQPTQSDPPSNRHNNVDSSSETASRTRDALMRAHEAAVAADDPEPYSPRASSFGIFRQILDEFSPEMVVNSSISALPGAQQTRLTPPAVSEQASGLEDVLGMRLPSKPEMDFLVESYLSSVHWFMMLFHEPSFHVRYERILVSHHLDRAQRRFAFLLVLIMGLGARYADPEQINKQCPRLDAKEFQNKALKKVEEHLLGLFDDVELESVQICVLLGSYYLYHGRPNLGFVVLGSGIRCAQSMSLHFDDVSLGATRIVREERRRTWWALFIFDRFASIVYGRPCGIRDGEFDVRVPENTEDTDVGHPVFGTSYSTPEGSIRQVTLFTYTKYKIQLYRIASPTVNDLHFFRVPGMAALSQKIQALDQELNTWYQSLPPELRLDRLYETTNASRSPKMASDTFAMQALALQIAYDNILILLHRPMFPHTIGNFTSPNDDGVHPSNSPLQARHSSQYRCWESALRTSNLGRYQSCLQSARQSHAAAFLGINLFTSGMVLCIVALSKPLSEQAQMAKRAIGRIMSLSQFLEGRALLASQTSKVLSEMVRLILDKEMKAIIGQASNETFGRPMGVTLEASRNGPDQAQQLGGDVVVADSAPNVSPQSSAELDNSRPVQNSGSGLDPTFGDFGEDHADPLAVSSLDLQSGLHFLQQAMYQPPDMGVQAWRTDEGGREIGDGRLSASSGTLDILGQSWLWDPNQWPDFSSFSA